MVQIFPSRRKVLPLCLAAVVAAGCSRPMEPVSGQAALQALTFEADVRQKDGWPGTLEVALTAHNSAGKAVKANLSTYCTARILAYETADRSGEPVWDEGKDNACPFVALVLELEAGKSRTFVREVPGARVPLPDGHYFFSVVVTVDETNRVVEAGSAEIVRP